MIFCKQTISHSRAGYRGFPQAGRRRVDRPGIFCYKRGMTVEQFLPHLHYGDAVGNSALALHRFLLSRGVRAG